MPSGKVEIVWFREERDGQRFFRFDWQESGGPAVAEPTRVGFGSRVIQTLLGEDFGGTVEVAYKPTGLECRLTAPLEKIAG